MQLLGNWGICSKPKYKSELKVGGCGQMSPPKFRREPRGPVADPGAVLIRTHKRVHTRLRHASGTAGRDPKSRKQPQSRKGQSRQPSCCGCDLIQLKGAETAPLV